MFFFLKNSESLDVEWGIKVLPVGGDYHDDLFGYLAGFFLPRMEGYFVVLESCCFVEEVSIGMFVDGVGFQNDSFSSGNKEMETMRFFVGILTYCLGCGSHHLPPVVFLWVRAFLCRVFVVFCWELRWEDATEG